MKVPKIIHQIWEGKIDPKIPICLQILARTFYEKNPTWEYHLWNGKEIDDFIHTNFREYMYLYKNLPYDVQRWDMIRYMILYYYGGVYVDLDTECFRPIDELFGNNSLYIGEEPPGHNIYPDIEYLIGNAFLASSEKNEGWIEILNEIESQSKVQYEKQDKAVLYTTGPFMLSKIYPRLKKLHNATTLSYTKVAPVTMQETRYYILGKDKSYDEKISEACCVHYFFGSWIPQCKGA